MANRNKYIGLENYDIPESERDYYVYFGVIDADGEEYGFYTNRALEGMFYWSDERGIYVQTEGTCQFDMGRTKTVGRNRLKAYMNYWKENR